MPRGERRPMGISAIVPTLNEAERMHLTPLPLAAEIDDSTCRVPASYKGGGQPTPR
jgi:hypothetical protein